MIAAKQAQTTARAVRAEGVAPVARPSSLRPVMGASAAPRAASSAAARRAGLPARGRVIRQAELVHSGSMDFPEDSDAPVVVVTGASRGIGKAIVQKMASKGCRVVINFISSQSEQARATCEECIAMGGDAIAVQADVSRRDEIDALFDIVMKKYGRVDVLVNNAGITRDTLMMRMKPEQWDAVINVNLSGVFYCSQAAAKIMMKQKRGRIINMASVVGVVGNAGQANYAAAKGGVIALTKTIAREYASRNITANAVAPGFIASDMTAAIDKKYEEQILKGIPLARYGSPEEVAGLVSFLALNKAALYITGQCYNIDGGMVM
ncbi:hypothetical protein HYH03_006311 [Edaphochlamys debaryana]|uniref:3-oxoacyl-[acyl-carrier-protein] reductase n=1 Tax=Edaphochlamys debaryana TaxID=47281 RepID=A0A835Y7P3_9CHLO|nr:hypothetical protein HYH03_006311 [Edaphochlamys debaryana]|eukprot:KAG2495711.1 hypothetical protein HYH03_006311 [Edaphochlamys debaryana]